MSIAEKLQVIAENEQKVFDAGKKAEYDAFWDPFQNYGKPMLGLYAKFARWGDIYYNPKYDIVCDTGGTINELYNQSNITDTKVRVDASQASQRSAVFGWSQKMHTIRSVVVSENTTYTNWFTWCFALKNITFEGTIKNNIDFKECPLTLESAINVIEHLYDYRTTTGAFPEAEGAFDFTVQFSESTWALLDADNAGTHGAYYDSWRDELNAKGWNT